MQKSVTNLSGVSGLSRKEVTEILAKNDHVRIERVVSTGQITPPHYYYDQEETEFVLVLQGTAKLRYETGEEITLEEGDYVVIPPHQKHQVSYTSTQPECIWLTVFY